MPIPSKMSLRDPWPSLIFTTAPPVEFGPPGKCVSARPVAMHVPGFVHVTDVRVSVSLRTSGAPGTPLSIGTTTPSPSTDPTATHEAFDVQATPLRPEVPGTDWTFLSASAAGAASALPALRARSALTAPKRTSVHTYASRRGRSRFRMHIAPRPT